MADLWGNCFEPGMNMPPKEFERTFCRVCRNQECDRSAGSKLLWVQRMTTQVDRLFENPNFADPNDPRYADIRAVDFPSAMREAMRLEISSRNNDWNVPSDEDASRMVAEMAARVAPNLSKPTPVLEPLPVVDDVDDEVLGQVLRSYDIRGASEIYKVTLVERIVGRPDWACTCKAFEFGRARPCKHIEYAMQLPAEPVTAPPQGGTESVPLPPVKPATLPPQKPPKGFQATDAPPPKPVPSPQAAPPPRGATQPGKPFYPAVPNIPMPTGGVMVDGSAPPPPRARPDVRSPASQEADPWAAPAPKKNETVIPVGGRVVLGGKK